MRRMFGAMSGLCASLTPPPLSPAGVDLRLDDAPSAELLADPARLLRIVRHLAPRGRHPIAAQDLLRLILVDLQDMSPPGKLPGNVDSRLGSPRERGWRHRDEPGRGECIRG